jgi:hypothetical protein
VFYLLFLLAYAFTVQITFLTTSLSSPLASARSLLNLVFSCRELHCTTLAQQPAAKFNVLGYSGAAACCQVGHCHKQQPLSVLAIGSLLGALATLEVGQLPTGEAPQDSSWAWHFLHSRCTAPCWARSRDVQLSCRPAGLAT